MSFQRMNQFAQTPLKGQVADILNPLTLSVQLDPASVETVIVGDAVKLVNVTGKQIMVEKCSASDVPFGYVVYTPKKESFTAGMTFEIGGAFSIVYLEASGSISRGGYVEYVVSGAKVQAQSANPVSGLALDNASSGDLLRVMILSGQVIPLTFTTMTAAKIVSSVITALTPASVVSMNLALGDVFTLTPGEDETINAANIPGTGSRKITLIVLTSGTTSRTLTFGTGFITTGTLATGTVTAKRFVLEFITDGTNVIEMSRTAAM